MSALHQDNSNYNITWWFQWRFQDLLDLAARMSEDIEVRDRRYRLRLYRSCFVGASALTFDLFYLLTVRFFPANPFFR